MRKLVIQDQEKFPTWRGAIGLRPIHSRVVEARETGVIPALETRPRSDRASHRNAAQPRIAAPCAAAAKIKRRREEPAGTTAAPMDDEMPQPSALSATERVSRLRKLLRSRGLTAYLIPSEDAHMSEYMAACDRRRHYITGFTGSAGTALVTLDGAYCWTDGRYFVQAAAELDPAVFTMMRMYEDPSVEEWASANLPCGSVIGVDAGTISVSTMKRFTDALKRTGKPEHVTLKALAPGDNLVDAIWGDERPATPCSQVFPHDVTYAGMTVAKKLDAVRRAMRARNAALHVVAALDEVAWLFNLRGSDVSFNPVFWSYATVSLEGATLYASSDRFVPGVLEALKADGVAVAPYDAIMGDLATMKLPSGAAVWIDPNTCNVGIHQVLSKRRREHAVEFVTKMGPIQIMKAAKNEVELSGMRSCHVRDGTALVKFLCWLEDQVTNKGLEPTECEAAAKLDGLRAKLDKFVSLSFPTISSAGANGAIVHYRPMVETCAKVTKNDMYLVDSGAQYRDGTTDVTRTIHMGTPTQWQRQCFTRVLRGHIALQRAVFPKGTTGHVLDAFARAPLWEGGLDYQHGTGHGVGSFLNVHEGPHVISFKAAALETALQPGFITSNEPGYYEENGFGIRIENLCVVEECEGMDTTVSKEKPFYRMGNLTHAPIQAKLVELGMLTSGEIGWLDKYNKSVYDVLAPQLEGDDVTLKWLWKNTRPVKEQQQEG